MKNRFSITASTLFILLFVTACASTKVSDRTELDTAPLPRPDHIWVYDFATTNGDVPDASALYGETGAHNEPQTEEQIGMGQEIGAEIATELVAQITAMGLPAERAGPETRLQDNDIVIHGYLLSIVQGDRTKRVAIGLGDGNSELKVAVEGFDVTPGGLVKLGGGDTDATGNKTPGAGVGLVSLLATHNPLGLIVSTGMKIHDERSGEASIGGRAKQTASEIASLLKKRFQQEGWLN